MQIGYVVRHKLVGVDITESSPALHQSLTGVEHDHLAVKIADDNYNAKFFGSGLTAGNIMCLQYKTRISSDLDAAIVERDFASMKPCGEIRNNTQLYEITKDLPLWPLENF